MEIKAHNVTITVQENEPIKLGDLYITIDPDLSPANDSFLIKIADELSLKFIKTYIDRWDRLKFYKVLNVQGLIRKD